MESRLAARLAAGASADAAAPSAVEEVIDEGEAPIGPTEAEEAAYLAEQGPTVVGVAQVPSGGSDAVEPEEAPAKLPAIEDLVQRIPAETREALDELFRARFVRVQRVPGKALKA